MFTVYLYFVLPLANAMCFMYILASVWPTRSDTFKDHHIVCLCKISEVEFIVLVL